VDLEVQDQLEEVICDVGDDVFKHVHVYEHLCNNAEMPLYPGCTCKETI